MCATRWSSLSASTGLTLGLIAFVVLHSAGAGAEPPPTITFVEAIGRTLERNPGVEIERQKIEQAAGSLQSANGLFDWGSYARAYNNITRLPIMVPNSPLLVQRTEELVTAVGVSRQFRSGVRVAPSFNLARTEVLPGGTLPATRAEVGVTVTVPLLRGLGPNGLAANEAAARSDLATMRHLSRHNIASQVAQSATAFWSCLAAQQTHDILVDTERRAEAFMSIINRLVTGGELPSAVFAEASADFLRRRSDRVSGALAVYFGRQQLGAAIGLDSAGMAEAPSAAGSFPNVTPMVPNPAGDAALVELALRRRGDYQAALTNRATAEVLRRKALDDAKQRLDFDVRVGYSGLEDHPDRSRYLGAFTSNSTGANLNTMLTLEWPFANNAARGEMMRRRALVRQAELASAQLATLVATEVQGALQSLRTAIEQRDIALQTVAALELVVEDQRLKVTNGESSVTALVQNEDRYFQARLALIQAVRAYALTLVDLRRVTGTLVEEAGDRHSVSTDALLRPPTNS